MTHVAPRIVNSVSYVTRIHDERDFSWQAQYLVMLVGGRCFSAQCKCRFICDKDLSLEIIFRGRRSIW